MRIAIMQPTYLPWSGYFDLMDQVDKFVILDDVQFSKQSWQQRNRIKTANGSQWLTVPVHRSPAGFPRISDVEIDNSRNWLRKHAQCISQSYSRSQFFPDVMHHLSGVYSSEWKNLADLNVEIIKVVLGYLRLDVEVIYASDLATSGANVEHVLQVCRCLGASEYLSPIGAQSYLGEGKPLVEEGISLMYQQYEPFPYRQLYPPFMSHLSVIDLLFNEGPVSLNYIREGRRQSLSPHNAARIVQEEVT